MSTYADRTEGYPYGLVAEYDTAEALTEAAERARLAGFTRMDAYSPFPIHGLSDAIGFRDSRVPYLVFFGGLFGAIFGFSLQYYVHVIDYPMDVGGKPLVSLPSMVPITFECTILFAGLTAFFSMLALNKLPRPYHAIFNAPGFERATKDRFFLAIEAKDPQYNLAQTRALLEETGALRVSEVEA